MQNMNLTLSVIESPQNGGFVVTAKRRDTDPICCQVSKPKSDRAQAEALMSQWSKEQRNGLVPAYEIAPNF